MSPGPTSPLFTIAPTSFGGRGVFASQHVPKDTLILSCKAPYANVICRKFRKEVCAWCFSWSWEAGRRSSWSLTIPLEPQRLAKSAGGVGPTGSGGTSAGVRFCGQICRDSWLADGEDTTDSGYDTRHAGLRGLINSTLERCITARERKGVTKPRTIPPLNGFELGWIAFLQALEELKNGDDVSSTFVEDAWERAGRLASFSRTSTPTAIELASLSKKPKLPKVEHVLPTMLSELELDTARFSLDGLMNKCIKESSQTSSQVHDDQPPNHSIGTWPDVLDLQDNSLSQIRLEPYMLASSIRIWAFIKFVVYSASRDAKGLSERTKYLVQMLKERVDTPDDTRAILGREPGNVFGLWDTAPEGVDNELLGWGLYSFGSYFNHDCSPTVYKRAKGRAMQFYTLRDVNIGEELCISYIKENDPIEKRREALRRWYFECACKKCETELRA